MIPTDLKVCNNVHTTLTSSEYSKKNYLFLEPVDLKYFPTYTSIISRPMDLGTLGQNIKKGLYKNRQEFFTDANLCFDNAINFHAGRKQNEWIVKMAVYMKKLVAKERKKAEFFFLESNKMNSSLEEVDRYPKDIVGMMEKNTIDKIGIECINNDYLMLQNNEIKKVKMKVTLKLSKSKGVNKNLGREKILNLQNLEGKKLIRSEKEVYGYNSSCTDSTPEMMVHSCISDLKTYTKMVKGDDYIDKTTYMGKKLKEKRKIKSESFSISSSLLYSPQKQRGKMTTTKNHKKENEVTTNRNKLKLKIKLNSNNYRDNESSTWRSSTKTIPSVNNISKVFINEKKNDIEDKIEGKNNLNRGGKNLSLNVAQQNKSRIMTKSLSTQSRGMECSLSSPEVVSGKEKLRLNIGRGLSPHAMSEPSKKCDTSIRPFSSPLTLAKNKICSYKCKLESKEALSAEPTSAIIFKTSMSATKSQHIIGALTSIQKAYCSKVLSAFKLRNQKHAHWFLKPVSDSRLIEDYRAKISYPMDLGTIGSKLDKNQYKTVREFVVDLRRVFANCLRYNADGGNTFRPVARDMIVSTEEILQFFIGRTESQLSYNFSHQTLYPNLLYCWKMCLQILDSVISLNNGDGFPAAHYFLHPVSFYFGGEFPAEYSEKVQVPMDLGTITSKLLEGIYQSVGAFVDDCKLIVTNCCVFYGPRKDGTAFTTQANVLDSFMSSYLDGLLHYDKSLPSLKARNQFTNSLSIMLSKPPMEFLKSMLQELRDAKYTDKFTKLTETATAHFEEPVDISRFPDYPKYVVTPMALQTVDINIENNVYETPEDFEYDVLLVFRNCEAYNVPKKNSHMANLAKHCTKVFRKIYFSRIKTFEISGGKNIYGEVMKKRVLSQCQSKLSIGSSLVTSRKKSRTELPSVKIDSKQVKRKSVTFPSLKLYTLNKMKLPRYVADSGTGLVSHTPRITINKNGSVPIYMAISQIKEKFPNRRSCINLNIWETGCSRFFRELMRHSWIAVSRPKFIFHVPVSVLFPEIKDAYASKITKPMDLTTAECMLMQGGFYRNAQDFVDDVALIFANAVTFNSAGHEEGEPMSCAYFDVSRHLLKYTRWLSLEYLSPFFSNDMQTKGENQDNSITQWKLSTENRKNARQEMECIVLKSIIEKSDKEDKYTWMECECEKLIKSLRHQTDSKHMTFFLQPNYPADYFAYISKPMYWEHCQKMLQERNYNTFGEIVVDLRLIFSNAIKYNSRFKNTETDSGKAYDSAQYMSKKLETAIYRMLLSISDRLEREKIEQVMFKREIPVMQQADKQGCLENETTPSGFISKELETSVETIKIIQKRAPLRRNIDFDYLFYDEEPTREHYHLEALKHQKLVFEKQKKAREEMYITTFALGLSIYDKMQERANAISWATTLSDKIINNLTVSPSGLGNILVGTPNIILRPSKILDIISNSERNRIKFILAKSRTCKRIKQDIVFR